MEQCNFIFQTINVHHQKQILKLIGQDLDVRIEDYILIFQEIYHKDIYKVVNYFHHNQQ